MARARPLKLLVEVRKELLNLLLKTLDKPVTEETNIVFFPLFSRAAKFQCNQTLYEIIPRDYQMISDDA
jgi:hypothetical protein